MNTGEPYDAKVSRTVRWGALGKVPSGNSPAAYPTVEAAILERQKQAALREELNSKAAEENEALLEKSERAPSDRKTGHGGWYFRMVAPGVKYYSF